MPLSGPFIEPANGNLPDSAIILLHGVGADGENLIGIAPFLAEEFPSTVFISPNAPFECDMAPIGYQWFSLQDRDPQTMLEGVQNVQPIVDLFIDETLAKYNLPPSKLAIIGFSQGTMTALHVAPRRKEQLAAIVGFSGALLAPELLDEVVTKPDICLIHGEDDDVVPFELMHKATQELQQAGFNTQSHTRPNLPHSIDPEGLQIAKEFLKERL